MAWVIGDRAVSLSSRVEAAPFLTNFDISNPRGSQ